MIGPNDKITTREDFEVDEFLNDDDYINMMIENDGFTFESADFYEEDDDNDSPNVDEELVLLSENGY